MAAFLTTLVAHPIIILFLFLNLAIGFWAHRQSKANSFEDYALASKSLPTGVLVMTLLATLMSSTDLSEIDCVLDFGILYPVLYFFRFAIPALFVGAFIAPNLVFFNQRTFGGVMGMLYGCWAQLLTGLIHLLFSLAMIAAQISTIGALSIVLLETSFYPAVVFFGGVVVLYSTLGGMRAVSYTDVLQLVMAFCVFFWVTQKAVLHDGGLGKIVQRVAESYPGKLEVLSRLDLFMKIRGSLYWSIFSFAFTMSPPMVHRMLMVKDKSQVSKMWYTSIFVYGIIVIMMITIGLFGVINQQVLQLDNGSNLLAHMIKKLFADYPWIIDCMTVGMIGMLLSTMDSFLHTIGIVLVEDIIEPMRSLLDYKYLNEDKKRQYAKLGILSVGVLAILVGTQIEKIELRFILRKFMIPTIAIQTMVTIPFILGVMGLKTDNLSFFSFCGVYSFAFYGQKWLVPWRGYSSDYEYFLIALPLGILAYFIAHVVHNKGIVTTTRGRDYIAERLRIPIWQGTLEYVKSWLLAPFNLHILASRKIANNPTHSLSFSMLIFALYTFSSVMTGGSDDVGLANFMAGVHLVGITLCVGLMLEGIWPDRLKPYFALYWFCTLFYCLSFGSTLAFLREHGNMTAVIKWSVNFIFLLALVDSMSFIILSFLGSGLAMASWYVVFGSIPSDVLGSIGLPGGYLLFSLLVIVILFERSKERDLKERFYLKSAFSHAMTHESTQPLSEIDVLSMIHKRTIDDLSPMQNAQGEKGFWIPDGKKGMLEQGSLQIGKAVQEIKNEFSRFNKLIEDEISTLERKQVSMRSLIESIVPTLPRRHTERVKVKVKCTKDFEAILIHPLFGNVFANFIKNAYLHGNASEMDIHIDGAKRKICVRDNGRGIKEESLPRIFDLHFTTASQASSGVGLALVKIIVQASGGKISCHSRHGDKGSFTAFVMEFPEV